MRVYFQTLTKHIIALCEQNVEFPEVKINGGVDKSLARPTSRCILFDG